MSNVNINPASTGDILIVDDTPSDLKLLSGILRDAGYTVRPATDGELALRSVQAKLPELILLDINMPDLDGYEVCRRLKDSEDTRDIPVIFISVNTSPLDKVKAFGVGGVDYITKPFEPEDVLARVATHLALWKGQDELAKEVIERKLAEEALKESEEFSSSLLDNSPNPILVINPDTSVRYVNPALEKLTGFSSAEVLSRKAPYPWWTEETLQKTSVDLSKAMHKGTQRLEELFQKKNGERFWVEITSTPVRSNGEFKYYLANWVEVTERKGSDEALRASEAQKKAILDASIDRIRLVDKDMKIIWANETTTRELNITPEDLLGQYCYKAFVGRDSPCSECPTKKVLDSGKIEHIILHQPYSKGIEGETYWDAYIVPIKNESGDIVNIIQISRNITETKKAEEEKKKLEAQLLQAQKMEAVGTLADGISHDFNNLLQAIQGYSDILLLRKKKDDPDYQELKEINRAAQRASELTQQLLTFSRKVESKLRPVNLNHEVKQVEKLLKRTIPKMIEIELHLTDELSTINADPAQMEQVMMNLGVNARDAMPDGGRLIIETENITLDEEYCKTHLGATPGDYVLLTISDTGHGMDKDTLEHIFEPFYTTKETGMGTGIGLAMVYGIVKSHNGYITCYSEPGEGTTFKVYLPAIELETELEEVKEEEMPIGGTETILLVDDEETILNLGDQMLSNFGYTVITAPDGESALEIYHEKKEKINLIILDLIMPGMGGRRCLEKLLKINPHAKVLIASGYSVNGPTKEALEAEAKGFISKPYDVKKMLKAVRGALDGD